MRYQLNKTLPYWIQRYVFRRKDVVLEPLYHLEKVDRNAFSDGAGEQAIVQHAEKAVTTEATEGISSPEGENKEVVS